jgi:PEP-CTERM motif-containing protein
MKAFSIFLAAALVPAAFAATITLHNTGVNASDVVVAPGDPTAFWSLSAKPAGATESIGSTPFRFNAGPYFADNAISAWVSPNANGFAGAGGIYTYDLVFDLTGLDPTTAAISGVFGTDNDGSISLNNDAPAATTCFGCFFAPTPFAFNSGFVAGLNTIHLNMNNGGDPSGFRVELSGTASVAENGQVPEPGTIVLTCAGLAGLLLVRRRLVRA